MWLLSARLLLVDCLLLKCEQSVQKWPCQCPVVPLHCQHTANICHIKNSVSKVFHVFTKTQQSTYPRLSDTFLLFLQMKWTNRWSLKQTREVPRLWSRLSPYGKFGQKYCLGPCLLEKPMSLPRHSIWASFSMRIS